MIVAYLRQRFPPRVFAPALSALSAAAWISGPSSAPSALGRAAVAMVLLVGEFRVWDDLEDRAHDREAHPDRILPRVSPEPVERLRIALGASALLSVSPGRRAVCALVLCHAAMGAAYRVLRPRVAESSWRFGVLPLKYPAFVAIAAMSVGDPRRGRLVALSLAALAVAGAYEAWHNRPAPSASRQGVA